MMTYTELLDNTKTYLETKAINMKSAYYQDYFFRYLNADHETRMASLEHWMKCHAENILADREDLIIFSAKMLGSILLAEKYANFKANAQ